MTPAARTQAAIEILDAIITAAHEDGAAADTLIARYFAKRRYAGSKDRRAVRELVYAAVRRAGDVPASGRGAVIAIADEQEALAASFDGSKHGPSPIDANEPRAMPGIAPAWLVEALRESGIADAQMPRLLDRAPLDVRVNTLRMSRDEVLTVLDGATPAHHAPMGMRLPAGTHVEMLDPWRSGAIEVQDEGSQIVSLASDAKPGQRIVDLCAGGGGKTLAIAALMENQGTLLATDTDRGRLSRLRPRVLRAGVTIVETRLLDPGKERAALHDWDTNAHTVLVDAPCSGTGTWRRNPEARWRLTQDRLARLVETQRQLLGIAAELVAPGGAIVYIVCSLLDAEGALQVERFLTDYPDWAADDLQLVAGSRHGAGIRLQPAVDGTDGFFVARLRRPC